jgi:hypothetical protein
MSALDFASLNSLVPSRRQVALIVGLAALVSIGLAIYRPAKSELFYLEIALRSSQPGTSQLFYDLGHGFNESDSVRLPALETMSLLRFPLPIGRYKTLRFDPIDRGGSSVVFGNSRIVGGSGHVVRNVSVQEFKARHDIPDLRISDGTIIMDLTESNSDPILSIELDPPLSLETSAASLFLQAAKSFLVSFVLSCLALFGGFVLISQKWLYAVPLYIALAGFVFLLARSRFLAPISWDEGYFIFYGWLVKGGSVPYRDFVEPKPPVIFFANALGLSLFGLKDFLFRVIPTVLAVASIALLFVAMIKRRVATWLNVLLTAQVALWLLGDQFHDTGLNDSETYGFAFTLAGFSIGLIGSSFNARFARIAVALLSGFCFGLAVLSKELFVLSVVPAWLLSARRVDGPWDWRQLWVSAAGGVAVGLVFLAYLVAHSAFVPYLETIRFSRMFAANYCFDIGRFPKVSGFALLRNSWEMLHDQLYNFRHLAFVLGLWAALPLLIFRKPRRRAVTFEILTAAAAVLLGILAISVGYCFWFHYYLMGTMGLFLLGLLGAEALSKFLSMRAAWVSVLAFVGLSTLFAFVAKAPTQRVLAEKHPPERVIPVDPLAVETINRHSKPHDYILDTDSALLYVVLNRKSPLPVVGFTDEFLAAALLADVPSMRIEILRERLEQHLPRVCYFSSSYRPRQEMYHQLLFDPLLAKYHYIKVDDRLWYLPEDHN